MLTFYPVNIEKELDRSNPLYVGNFFALKGMWWRKRKQRQGLIISIALAWYRIVKNHPGAEGFVERETFITNLTRQVKDAKVILERFFTVKRVGYYFDSNKRSPSIITPRRLNRKMWHAIAAISDDVVFEPGLAPTCKKLTMSSVHVQPGKATWVVAELKRTGRDDLIAPVEWLCKQQSPITFYFEPAGTLMARDKSIWPIRSIEMWPSWLRREMFGASVDIDNAYLQFVVQRLEKKYASNPRRLELKYPELLRANRNKTAFRLELCRTLGLEPSDDNIDKVKKIIMALANGSNISPTMMTNGSGRSEAVRLVHEACPDMTPSERLVVGGRLSVVARQFAAARRDLCLFAGKRPTKQNQKDIFRQYFSWEREARYKIWEASGKTGLMLHDGIDGVKTDLAPEELSHHITRETSIRVSVD